MTDQLEAALRTKLPRLEFIALHLEPAADAPRRNITLFEADRQNLAPLFGQAAWLRMDDAAPNGGPAQSLWLENPYREAAGGKGIKLAAWLIRLNAERACFAPDTPLDQPLAELLESAGITLDSRVTQAGEPLPRK